MPTDYTLLVKQVPFEKLSQAIASVSLPPGVRFNAYADADFEDDHCPSIRKVPGAYDIFCVKK